jgi:DNA polymerase/3'-5' exonuclease PolX
VVPIDEYPLQVLYFTGSDSLNIRMRIRATELGFKLGQVQGFF